MKTAILAVCIVLMTFGCSKDKNNETSGSVSRTKYNQLVTKYNDAVQKHNDIVSQNIKSDTLLIETQNLISALDQKATEVRTLSKKIVTQLGEYKTRGQLEREYKSLELLVNQALELIEKLEIQTSRKNIDQIMSNVDKTIVESAQKEYKNSLRIARLATVYLSGLRDLFLSEQNDITALVNARLRVLLPERRREPREEEINPIVENMEQGGRITGIARNSTTGGAISDAFVGFKRRPEGSDYFYETKTNAEGQYQSPPVRPGTYYVDINKPGFINVRARPVAVQRGREARETFSLSEPLPEGVYRITMSWTTEAEGAVRDVDSYLAIPGATQPLSYHNAGRNYFGADLDRDDTDWAGPETVTIRNLKRGTYIYYVNNYNLRENKIALGNSRVRIAVYKGGILLRQFSVPTGRGLSYEVFRIVNGEFESTGRFNDTLTMH